jgi:hypothetical protein
MTTSHNSPEMSREQTIEEYLADLTTKPTADLTRGDLLWLAEELHSARHFLTLFPDDGITTATFMNRLLDCQCRFEEIEKVFGTTTIQEIYDVIERLHEGEPPMA